MLTEYTKLNKVVKSPFKHFHCAFLCLKPLRMTACHCSLCSTFEKHRLVCPWNVKVKCKKRVPGEAVYRFSLSRSPGSLGESLIFSPTSWVPAAVQFLTVILSRPTELLSGSVSASPWERKVSRTFNHSVYIQGNNTVWTAGPPQGGVTMIYQQEVQFAVYSTQTHPHSLSVPLNLI